MSYEERGGGYLKNILEETYLVFTKCTKKQTKVNWVRDESGRNKKKKNLYLDAKYSSILSFILFKPFPILVSFLSLLLIK